MSQVIDYSKYNSKIKIIWRDGTAEDPYVDISESWKIVNNKIVLSEIPDKIEHVTINGYSEIYSGTPGSNQFIVNYQNGIVTFNPSEEGKTVDVNYKGRGIILYPASRLYNDNTNPDVIQTIQDMIDTYQDLLGQATGHKHSGAAGDAPQIPAGYIPISDALNIIDATNVEDALQEIMHAFANHKTDNMPHKFQDNDIGKTYKYGFKQENGFVVFMYEEVI